MKKRIFILALALVFGLSFYVIESKADHTMGPELKGAGYGSGSGEIPPGKAIERPQAINIFENYLQSQNNANLKLGRVEDTGRFFKADILDQNNSLMDVIHLDKETGSLKSSC